MGTYSPEPPRKNCVLHFSFDHRNEDDVLDLSPQESDGTITGSAELTTGTVGNALRFGRDSGSYITADGAAYDVSRPHSAVAAVRVRDLDGRSSNVLSKFDGSTTNGVLFRIDGTTGRPSLQLFDGGSQVLDMQADVAVDDGDWHTVGYRLAGGGEAAIFVDGSLAGTDSTTALPTDPDADIWLRQSPHNSNEYLIGSLDEPRAYRTDLTDEQFARIHSIGAYHNNLTAFEDVWDNRGIPFRGNNRRFAGALGEENDAVRRQLDYLLDARHINEAAGEQLGRIGNLVGVSRRENESDEKYRARIKGTIVTGRSSGTFSDILNATSSVLNVAPEKIQVEEQYDSDPGTAFVYISSSDLDNTPLSVSDLKSILSDVVLGGHAIEVVEQGANPFTVIDQTTTNDPEKGLTSDSTNKGGSLVSDV